MSEARPSSSIQSAGDPTNVSLEAVVLDQISPSEGNQDDREVQSNTRETTEDFAVYEDGISPLTKSTRTLLNSEVEVPQEKTRLERRQERTYSRPTDPEYARLLGPNVFDVIFTAKALTKPDFQKSQLIRKEDKKVDGPPGRSKNNTGVPSDWIRKRRHSDITGTGTLPNSQDLDYQHILSAEPIATAVDGTTWPRRVSVSTLDDEYREIFRRHNFSFSNLPQSTNTICRVCGRWKSISQNSRYHRICNDCYLTITTTKVQPSSSSSICRRCENCLSDKPIDGFKVISGRTVCYDCRTIGSQKGNHRACPDQHADHRDAVRGNMIIQPVNNKRRRRDSRPPGFVGSKDLLKSLKNPVVTQKAGPKRKYVQQDEATGLHGILSRRDQRAWQCEESMKSDNPEPPSSTRSTQGPSVSNSRLINLGIKTATTGPPVWIRVSRSAPLGEMFVAALQSDDALRGYAFMLPGQFVRWDDTPDEVCCRHHCEWGTTNCKSSSVSQTMIASKCINSLKLGYRMLDADRTKTLQKRSLQMQDLHLMMRVREHPAQMHLSIPQNHLLKRNHMMLAKVCTSERRITTSLTRSATTNTYPMTSRCQSQSIPLMISPHCLTISQHHRTALQPAPSVRPSYPPRLKHNS